MMMATVFIVQYCLHYENKEYAPFINQYQWKDINFLAHARIGKSLKEITKQLPQYERDKNFFR